jgi:hypothetical protein
MPNTFEYATWLAMESLDLLESKRAVSQYFNTDYSKEFKQKFPIGDSVQVPYPQQFTVRNGLAYNPQTINRRHATINFDEPFGIDFEWDSAEQYLRAPRGPREGQQGNPRAGDVAARAGDRFPLRAVRVSARGVRRGRPRHRSDLVRYASAAAAPEDAGTGVPLRRKGAHRAALRHALVEERRDRATSTPSRTSPSSSGPASSARATASSGTSRCRSTGTPPAPGRAP